MLCDSVKATGKDLAHFVAENDEYEHVVQTSLAGQQQSKNICGQTALHLAVALRNKGMVKLLVAMGATPILKDKNNETVLMRCIELGLDDEFDLLLELCPGVRLEVSDRQGRTPLHWALSCNREKMAKKLVDLGHDCYMEDQDKEVPVLLASKAAMPHLLEPMLAHVDPFLLQQQWGSGPVSLDGMWLKFVSDELAKAETTKLLQKKLDVIVKQQQQAAAEKAKAGHKPPKK